MKEELEQNKQKKPIGLFGKMIIIGLAGGIIWSALAVVLHYFNFAEVAPKTFLLRPWLQTEWTDNWEGHLLSIFLSGIISLIPAIIYYSLLKKINSMWVGVGYGIVLWGLLFLLLQPLLPLTVPITELSADTIVTTLCIFILYGTFIGYSISYDYHDMEIRKSRQKA